MKGCETGKHSNIKPQEPEKQQVSKEIEETEPSPSVVASEKPAALERPDFNKLLVPIEPIVAPALKQSIDNLVAKTVASKPEDGYKDKYF